MIYKIIVVILLTIVLCACGTREGNGMVSIEVGDHTKGAIKGRMAFPNGVTSLTMCFKQVRFRADGDSSGAHDILFDVGEKVFTGAAATLGEASLPNGNYKRIEFLLHDKCASGKSVEVVNNHGTFNTAKSINLKFRGDFTMAGANARVVLSINAIADALSSVDDGGQIKTKAEDAEGTY